MAHSRMALIVEPSFVQRMSCLSVTNGTMHMLDLYLTSATLKPFVCPQGQRNCWLQCHKPPPEHMFRTPTAHIPRRQPLPVNPPGVCDPAGMRFCCVMGRGVMWRCIRLAMLSLGCLEESGTAMPARTSWTSPSPTVCAALLWEALCARYLPPPPLCPYPCAPPPDRSEGKDKNREKYSRETKVKKKEKGKRGKKRQEKGKRRREIRREPI